MSPKSHFVIAVLTLTAALAISIRCSAGGTPDRPAQQPGQACELCFFQPDNMTFDAQGNIYLVDTDHKHRSRILKLSSEGKELADWRVFTDGPGTDNGPNGIAIDRDGNIYAPDGAAGRVLKLSPAGKIIQVFGPMEGTFKYVHVAVAGDGKVYVVEPAEDVVKKFAADGKLIASWHRTHGPGLDQWHNPQTIAVGRDHVLVLDDWGNDRIEILSEAGETRLIFRGAGAPDERLVSSSGACVDDDGGIYVADYERSRVKEYDSDGQLLKTIGNDGGQQIFEHAPFSIACGRDGNLYSADGLSVVKYSKDGRVLARWR